jgi:signal peptidase I
MPIGQPAAGDFIIMFSRIRYSSFFAAFLVILTLTSWLVFLPIQFGGATAYVIVNGNSMQPTYQMGDLVITRREASYGKGDIVTYYNTDIKRFVIHRIVDVNSGIFILQGDNNPWVDNETPRIESITGKAWIHIPGLGVWLARLQTPLGLSLLSGLVFFLILSMYAFREKDLRKRIRKFFSGTRLTKIPLTFSAGDVSMKQIGHQLEILIFVFVIIIAASLLLAFVSFDRDEYLTKTIDSEFLHVGLYSYSASSLPGVYDPGNPETGDPIFLKTTCRVMLRYDYHLAGEPLLDARGTISLRAETRDINGWRRSFPLVPETGFEGTSTFVQTEINPCQILSVLRQAEEKTGLYRANYLLVIIPEVNIRGNKTDGLPVETSFSPLLTFSLDDFQLYVQPEFSGEDPLSPFEIETQAVSSQVQNLIQFPGFAMTVSVARIIAMVGLLTSIALGGLLGFQVFSALKRDPAVAISLRYGSLLAEVAQVSFNVHSREVIVSSFDDLVKLAERNATVIMHLRHPQRDEFLVEGSNMVYRFDMPRQKEIDDANERA